MVIEIDFQSGEALYTQLMNQIITGNCHITAAGRRSSSICQAACRYHRNQYAYRKQGLLIAAPGGLCIH